MGRARRAVQGREAMKEEDLSFAALSAITCRFTRQQYRENEDGFFCEILIASFEGEYRHGGAGNDDAIYMAAMLRAAFSAWHPAALVLDFEHLIYEWGDYMDAPLRASEEERRWEGGIPTAVVASALNERGLRSLVDEVMGDDPDDWLCPSRDAAIARVLEKWKQKRAAAGHA